MNMTYQSQIDYYEVLSERLTDLRRDAGYTQEEVADYLNISRQAYSNYEHNRRKPDLVSLIRLAELYHLSLDSLRPGKE